MFSCGGSNADMLSRLSSRLHELEVHVPQGLQNRFKDIVANMEDLKNKLGREKESKVMEQLNHAARFVDEIDTDPKIAPSKLMDELQKAIAAAVAAAAVAAAEAAKAAGGEDTVKKETTSASTTTDQWEEPKDYVTDLEKKLQKSPAWAHLKLVVDSLEPLLKDCLFTVTVFPPNVDIQKRLLLHWWMGEGFVRCIEDGKRRFNQLVEKGFIVPVGKRHCEKHHYCQVQSWLRPLLVAVSNANGFLDYDEADKPSNDYSFSGRLCVRAGRELASFDDGMASSPLTTVYNVDGLQAKFQANWLLNKKKLTTLQLGRWRKDDKKLPVLAFDDEVLSGLENCSGLRYLSLRGVSRLESLPHHSVEKLRKLVVLDLRACHNLEKLPPNLGHARRLQFLDVSDCTLLDQMPKTLASLSELEVLKGFVVCNYWNENCCQVGDLLKLTKLRKLSITTSREFNDREVAKLGELINGLTSLTITWGVVKRNAERVNARVADKNLKPASSSKLEKLELRCFNEKRLPKWIVPEKLKNLKKLYVTGGMLESLEGAQGKTWSVKVLRVRSLDHLLDQWESITTWFPRLKCVQKFNCCGAKLPCWPCDKKGYWPRDGKSSNDGADGGNSEVEEVRNAPDDSEKEKMKLPRRSEVEKSSNVDEESENEGDRSSEDTI